MNESLEQIYQELLKTGFISDSVSPEAFTKNIGNEATARGVHQHLQSTGFISEEIDDARFLKNINNFLGNGSTDEIQQPTQVEPVAREDRQFEEIDENNEVVSQSTEESQIVEFTPDNIFVDDREDFIEEKEERVNLLKPIGDIGRFFSPQEKKADEDGRVKNTKGGSKIIETIDNFKGVNISDAGKENEVGLVKILPDFIEDSLHDLSELATNNVITRKFLPEFAEKQQKFLDEVAKKRTKHFNDAIQKELDEKVNPLLDSNTLPVVPFDKMFNELKGKVQERELGEGRSQANDNKQAAADFDQYSKNYLELMDHQMQRRKEKITDPTEKNLADLDYAESHGQLTAEQIEIREQLEELVLQRNPSKELIDALEINENFVSQKREFEIDFDKDEFIKKANKGLGDSIGDTSFLERAFDLAEDAGIEEPSKAELDIYIQQAIQETKEDQDLFGTEISISGVDDQSAVKGFIQSILNGIVDFGDFFAEEIGFTGLGNKTTDIENSNLTVGDIGKGEIKNFVKGQRTFNILEKARKLKSSTNRSSVSQRGFDNYNLIMPNGVKAVLSRDRKTIKNFIDDNGNIIPDTNLTSAHNRVKLNFEKNPDKFEGNIDFDFNWLKGAFTIPQTLIEIGPDILLSGGNKTTMSLIFGTRRTGQGYIENRAENGDKGALTNALIDAWVEAAFISIGGAEARLGKAATGNLKNSLIVSKEAVKKGVKEGAIDLANFSARREILKRIPKGVLRLGKDVGGEIVEEVATLLGTETLKELVNGDGKIEGANLAETMYGAAFGGAGFAPLSGPPTTLSGIKSDFGKLLLTNAAQPDGAVEKILDDIAEAEPKMKEEIERKKAMLISVRNSNKIIDDFLSINKKDLSKYNRDYINELIVRDATSNKESSIETILKEVANRATDQVGEPTAATTPTIPTVEGAKFQKDDGTEVVVESRNVDEKSGEVTVTRTETNPDGETKTTTVPVDQHIADSTPGEEREIEQEAAKILGVKPRSRKLVFDADGNKVVDEVTTETNEVGEEILEDVNEGEETDDTSADGIATGVQNQGEQSSNVGESVATPSRTIETVNSEIERQNTLLEGFSNLRTRADIGVPEGELSKDNQVLENEAKDRLQRLEAEKLSLESQTAIPTPPNPQSFTDARIADRRGADDLTDAETQALSLEDGSQEQRNAFTDAQIERRRGAEDLTAEETNFYEGLEGQPTQEQRDAFTNIQIAKSQPAVQSVGQSPARRAEQIYVDYGVDLAPEGDGIIVDNNPLTNFRTEGDKVILDDAEGNEVVFEGERAAAIKEIRNLKEYNEESFESFARAEPDVIETLESANGQAEGNTAAVQPVEGAEANQATNETDQPSRGSTATTGSGSRPSFTVTQNQGGTSTGIVRPAESANQEGAGGTQGQTGSRGSGIRGVRPNIGGVPGLWPVGNPEFEYVKSRVRGRGFEWRRIDTKKPVTRAVADRIGREIAEAKRPDGWKELFPRPEQVETDRGASFILNLYEDPAKINPDKPRKGLSKEGKKLLKNNPELFDTLSNVLPALLNADIAIKIHNTRSEFDAEVGNASLKATEESNVSRSIAGERGLRNSNTPQARAAMDALSTAVDMEKQLGLPDKYWETARPPSLADRGEIQNPVFENIKKIRVVTGWERGGDGKWRYETRPGRLRNRFVRFFLTRIGKNKLSDFYVNDELFELYPELKDLELEIGAREGIDAANGSFNGSSIFINTRQFKDLVFDDVNGNSTVVTERRFSLEMLSTLEHEIQHAVQRLEAFAEGGSVAIAIMNEDIRIENELIGDKLKALDKKRDIIGKKQRELWRNAGMVFPDFKDPQLSAKLQEFERKRKSIALEETPLINEVSSIYAQKQDLRNSVRAEITERLKGFDGFETYRKILGEVEARNVQARLNFTDEQRRNTTLLETEDIERESQSFVGFGSGDLNISQNSESNVSQSRAEQSLEFDANDGTITLEEAIQRNNGNPMSQTPDGKESKLYKDILALPEIDGDTAKADQFKSQVYNDNFLRWFGDWLSGDKSNVSKVVDGKREPLLVYHGTNKNFDTFSKEFTGRSSGNNGWFGEGFYFAPDRIVARGYAHNAATGLNSLNISDSDLNLYKEWAFGIKKEGFDYLPIVEKVQDLRKEAKKRVVSAFLNLRKPQYANIEDGVIDGGFDVNPDSNGTIVNGILNNNGDSGIYEIKVDDSNQIKSVFNNGQFSQTDSNISQSRGPSNVSRNIGDTLGEQDARRFSGAKYKDGVIHLDANNLSQEDLIQAVISGLADKGQFRQALIKEMKGMPSLYNKFGDLLEKFDVPEDKFEDLGNLEFSDADQGNTLTVPAAAKEIYDEATKLRGRNSVWVLENNERTQIPYTYMLATVDAVQASHDNQLTDNPNFPFYIDDQGKRKTGNSKDYSTDGTASTLMSNAAKSVDQGALQNLPFFTKEGVQASGNSRNIIVQKAHLTRFNNGYVKQGAAYTPLTLSREGELLGIDERDPMKTYLEAVVRDSSRWGMDKETILEYFNEVQRDGKTPFLGGEIQSNFIYNVGSFHEFNKAASKAENRNDRLRIIRDKVKGDTTLAQNLANMLSNFSDIGSAIKGKVGNSTFAELFINQITNVVEVIERNQKDDFVAPDDADDGALRLTAKGLDVLKVVMLNNILDKDIVFLNSQPKMGPILAKLVAASPFLLQDKVSGKGINPELNQAIDLLRDYHVRKQKEGSSYTISQFFVDQGVSTGDKASVQGGLFGASIEGVDYSWNTMLMAFLLERNSKLFRGVAKAVSEGRETKKEILDEVSHNIIDSLNEKGGDRSVLDANTIERIFVGGLSVREAVSENNGQPMRNQADGTPSQLWQDIRTELGNEGVAFNDRVADRIKARIYTQSYRNGNPWTTEPTLDEARDQLYRSSYVDDIKAGDESVISRSIGPEQNDLENQIARAESDLDTAIASLDRKRRELGNRLNENQTSLFNEPKQNPTLFDQGVVESDNIPLILQPFQQAVDRARDELRRLKDLNLDTGTGDLFESNVSQSRGENDSLDFLDDVAKQIYLKDKAAYDRLGFNDKQLLDKVYSLTYGRLNMWKDLDGKSRSLKDVALEIGLDQRIIDAIPEGDIYIEESSTKKVLDYLNPQYLKDIEGRGFGVDDLRSHFADISSAAGLSSANLVYIKSSFMQGVQARLSRIPKKELIEHEIIHSVTVNYLTNPASSRVASAAGNSEAESAVDFLFEAFDRVSVNSSNAGFIILGRERYGLTNIKEFVAEFMVNPYFRGFVKSRLQEKPSFYQRIIDAIKTIFRQAVGVDRNDPAISEITDNIFKVIDLQKSFLESYGTAIRESETQESNISQSRGPSTPVAEPDTSAEALVNALLTNPDIPRDAALAAIKGALHQVGVKNAGEILSRLSEPQIIAALGGRVKPKQSEKTKAIRTLTEAYAAGLMPEDPREVAEDPYFKRLGVTLADIQGAMTNGFNKPNVIDIAADVPEISNDTEFEGLGLEPGLERAATNLFNPRKKAPDQATKLVQGLVAATTGDTESLINSYMPGREKIEGSIYQYFIDRQNAERPPAGLNTYVLSIFNELMDQGVHLPPKSALLYDKLTNGANANRGESRADTGLAMAMGSIVSDGTRDYVVHQLTKQDGVHKFILRAADGTQFAVLENDKATIDRFQEGGLTAIEQEVVEGIKNALADIAPNLKVIITSPEFVEDIATREDNEIISAGTTKGAYNKESDVLVLSKDDIGGATGALTTIFHESGHVVIKKAMLTRAGREEFLDLAKKTQERLRKGTKDDIFFADRLEELLKRYDGDSNAVRGEEFAVEFMAILASKRFFDGKVDKERTVSDGFIQSFKDLIYDFLVRMGVDLDRDGLNNQNEYDDFIQNIASKLGSGKKITLSDLQAIPTAQVTELESARDLSGRQGSRAESNVSQSRGRPTGNRGSAGARGRFTNQQNKKGMFKQGQDVKVYHKTPDNGYRIFAEGQFLDINKLDGKGRKTVNFDGKVDENGVKEDGGIFLVSGFHLENVQGLGEVLVMSSQAKALNRDTLSARQKRELNKLLAVRSDIVGTNEGADLRLWNGAREVINIKMEEIGEAPITREQFLTYYSRELQQQDKDENFLSDPRINDTVKRIYLAQGKRVRTLMDSERAELSKFGAQAQVYRDIADKIAVELEGLSKKELENYLDAAIQGRGNLDPTALQLHTMLVSEIITVAGSDWGIVEKATQELRVLSGIFHYIGQGLQHANSPLLVPSRVLNDIISKHNAHYYSRVKSASVNDTGITTADVIKAYQDALKAMKVTKGIRKFDKFRKAVSFALDKLNKESNVSQSRGSNVSQSRGIDATAADFDFVSNIFKGSLKGFVDADKMARAVHRHFQSQFPGSEVFEFYKNNDLLIRDVDKKIEAAYGRAFAAEYASKKKGSNFKELMEVHFLKRFATPATGLSEAQIGKRLSSDPELAASIARDMLIDMRVKYEGGTQRQRAEMAIDMKFLRRVNSKVNKDRSFQTKINSELMKIATEGLSAFTDEVDLEAMGVSIPDNATEVDIQDIIINRLSSLTQEQRMALALEKVMRDADGDQDLTLGNLAGKIVEVVDLSREDAISLAEQMRDAYFAYAGKKNENTLKAILYNSGNTWGVTEGDIVSLQKKFSEIDREARSDGSKQEAKIDLIVETYKLKDGELTFNQRNSMVDLIAEIKEHKPLARGRIAKRLGDIVNRLKGRPVPSDTHINRIVEFLNNNRLPEIKDNLSTQFQMDPNIPDAVLTKMSELAKKGDLSALKEIVIDHSRDSKVTSALLSSIRAGALDGGVDGKFDKDIPQTAKDFLASFKIKNFTVKQLNNIKSLYQDLIDAGNLPVSEREAAEKEALTHLNNSLDALMFDQTKNRNKGMLSVFKRGNFNNDDSTFNDGRFDSQALLEAFAKDNNLKFLTREDFRKIARLHDIVKTSPSPTVRNASKKALNAMMRKASNSKRQMFYEAYVSFAYINLLSGINTMLTAVLSSSMLAMFELMYSWPTRLGSRIGKEGVGRRGKALRAVRDQRNLIASLGEGKNSKFRPGFWSTFAEVMLTGAKDVNFLDYNNESMTDIDSYINKLVLKLLGLVVSKDKLENSRRLSALRAEVEANEGVENVFDGNMSKGMFFMMPFMAGIFVRGLSAIDAGLKARNVDYFAFMEAYNQSIPERQDSSTGIKRVGDKAKDLFSNQKPKKDELTALFDFLGISEAEAIQKEVDAAKTKAIEAGQTLTDNDVNKIRYEAVLKRRDIGVQERGERRALDAIAMNTEVRGLATGAAAMALTYPRRMMRSDDTFVRGLGFVSDSIVRLFFPIIKVPLNIAYMGYNYSPLPIAMEAISKSIIGDTGIQKVSYDISSGRWMVNDLFFEDFIFRISGAKKGEEGAFRMTDLLLKSKSILRGAKDDPLIKSIKDDAKLRLKADRKAHYHRQLMGVSMAAMIFMMLFDYEEEEDENGVLRKRFIPSENVRITGNSRQFFQKREILPDWVPDKLIIGPFEFQTKELPFAPILDAAGTISDKYYMGEAQGEIDHVGKMDLVGYLTKGYIASFMDAYSIGATNIKKIFSAWDKLSEISNSTDTISSEEEEGFREKKRDAVSRLSGELLSSLSSQTFSALKNQTNRLVRRAQGKKEKTLQVEGNDFVDFIEGKNADRMINSMPVLFSFFDLGSKFDLTGQPLEEDQDLRFVSAEGEDNLFGKPDKGFFHSLIYDNEDVNRFELEGIRYRALSAPRGKTLSKGDKQILVREWGEAFNEILEKNRSEIRRKARSEPEDLQEYLIKLAKKVDDKKTDFDKLKDRLSLIDDISKVKK